MERLISKVNKSRTPEDGISWLMDYVCRLLKCYPSFTPDYVWNELPMIQGWCYVAWAVENDGWLGFCGVKRSGAGYIKQYADELYAIAKESWSKKTK